MLTVVVIMMVMVVLLMINHYDGHDCWDDGGGVDADDGDDDVDDDDDVDKLIYSTVEPRLIWTPHYYGQFALFLWKTTHFLQIQPAQYEHALMWLMCDKCFVNSISMFPVLQ